MEFSGMELVFLADDESSFGEVNKKSLYHPFLPVLSLPDDMDKAIGRAEVPDILIGPEIIEVHGSSVVRPRRYNRGRGNTR